MPAPSRAGDAHEPERGIHPVDVGPFDRTRGRGREAEAVPVSGEGGDPTVARFTQRDAVDDQVATVDTRAATAVRGSGCTYDDWPSSSSHSADPGSIASTATSSSIALRARRSPCRRNTSGTTARASVVRMSRHPTSSSAAVRSSSDGVEHAAHRAREEVERLLIEGDHRQPLGRPSTRSARIVRWISIEPP